MSRHPDVNRNLPSIPAPGATLESLAISVQAVKQAIDSLGGYRGTATGRAVTFEDLIAIGLVDRLTVQSEGARVAYPLTPRPYAYLPVFPPVGQIATIIDSSTATWGATISDGGTFIVLAWWNGTAWTVIGA